MSVSTKRNILDHCNTAIIYNDGCQTRIDIESVERDDQETVKYYNDLFDKCKTSKEIFDLIRVATLEINRRNIRNQILKDGSKKYYNLLNEDCGTYTRSLTLYE